MKENTDTALQRIPIYEFPEKELRGLSHNVHTLQIILDLCIPEKELAKTRSQISFI